MMQSKARQPMDSEAERIVDEIYADVSKLILEWKEDNAVKRYGATLIDYRNHRLGTMKFSEELIDAMNEELLGRIIDDGELNETAYLEVQEWNN